MSLVYTHGPVARTDSLGVGFDHTHLLPSNSDIGVDRGGGADGSTVVPSAHVTQ